MPQLGRGATRARGEGRSGAKHGFLWKIGDEEAPAAHPAPRFRRHWFDGAAVAGFGSMSNATDEADRAYQRRVTTTVIRLAVLALLVFLCFRILSPFINPIIGGLVIAIVLHKPYERLSRAIGGRPRTAAVLVIAIALLGFLVPTLAFGASLFETASELSGALPEHGVKVPPPPDSVADWPVVGHRLDALWTSASENLESALSKLAPYLKDAGVWVVSKVGHIGWGLFLFIVSVVIAGALLPHGDAIKSLVDRFSVKMVGERGPELARLAASSVNSVTRGVIGVALIQAFLAGMGMLVVGVPGAGLWTLLVLIFAVTQLPTTIVLVPIILYVFMTHSTATGVLFAIWTGVVGVSDNILKPMLMGRGAEVPMLVLFLGSLGGFIAGGILGLFVGAVILSLGYTVFMAWLEGAAD
jgi:predicted PurR-regulated permease PerM